MNGRTYQEAHPGEKCTEEVAMVRGFAPCGKLAIGLQHGAWPRCAEHMPRVMSPEEAEVVEAAKAWAKKDEWRTTTREMDQRLRHAVDALPKPAPSLANRLRALFAKDVVRDKEEIIATIAEAADELERRGAK